MAPHSSTLAWKIPWMEEPGRLQSMGLRRVGHDWATSLSLFTFLHWRRKWQPTPVFLPGESQGRGSLVAAIYGVTQSRTWLKWLSSSSRVHLYMNFFSVVNTAVLHDLRLVKSVDVKWQYGGNLNIRSDQWLSRVRLFATPWIAARQASLSITNSRSSLRLMRAKYKLHVDFWLHRVLILGMMYKMHCEVKWRNGSGNCIIVVLYISFTK